MKNSKLLHDYLFMINFVTFFSAVRKKVVFRNVERDTDDKTVERLLFFM